MSTDNLKSYLSLTKLSYKEAVNQLLVKYGPVSDDYYREKSYNRFLNNEIKNITKGKYSKGSEGLYTHHIKENIFENLSVSSYIKFYTPPYKYQRRENLVYADLFEHLILHALISKETNGDFGLNGYQSYLEPMIEEWYIEHKIPNPDWMKACYKRAFLTKEETKKIITLLENEVINDALHKQNLRPVLNLAIRELTTYEFPYDLFKDEYQTFFRYNSKHADKKAEAALESEIESILTKIAEWDRKSIKEELIPFLESNLKLFLISGAEFQIKKDKFEAKKGREEEWERREIQKERNRVEHWKAKHPFLIKNGYFENTPRREVLRRMYDDKYTDKFKTFKAFINSKNPYLIEELLEELEKLLAKESLKN